MEETRIREFSRACFSPCRMGKLRWRRCTRGRMEPRASCATSARRSRISRISRSRHTDTEQRDRAHPGKVSQRRMLFSSLTCSPTDIMKTGWWCYLVPYLLLQELWGRFTFDLLSFFRIHFPHDMNASRVWSPRRPVWMYLWSKMWTLIGMMSLLALIDSLIAKCCWTMCRWQYRDELFLLSWHFSFINSDSALNSWVLLQSVYWFFMVRVNNCIIY